MTHSVIKYSSCIPKLIQLQLQSRSIIKTNLRYAGERIHLLLCLRLFHSGSLFHCGCFHHGFLSFATKSSVNTFLCQRQLLLILGLVLSLGLLTSFLPQTHLAPRRAKGAMEDSAKMQVTH